MPRKLKTYITNLGFFELALAAPSMKAALEAWGMSHNAFQHGFAKQTEDPKIIAATMAKPGVVLRRPVGTHGEFEENPKLPQDLWKLEPPKHEAPKAKNKAAAKPRGNSKSDTGESKKADQAAILSFAKARERREAARKKEEEKAERQRAKDLARAEEALAKAEKELTRATARHEEILAQIEQEREKLDRRAEAETTRWEAERSRLEAARKGARD